jgi:hypothetical protein
MKINKGIENKVQNIFDSKKEFHIKQAKLPIEEKIKILIELQKLGKIVNPEKTKDKRVWKI